MKTPALISGIPGRFLAILCLAGTVFAETNIPPASVPKAGSTATPPAIAANLNVARENVPLPAKPRLSPWTAEIVKLAQSGIDEGVMLAFVDNAGTFGLGADEIIYLSDLGVSGETINAMLQHDRELASGERLATIVSDPPTDSYFGVTLVTGRNIAGNKPKTVPATRAALAALAQADDANEKAAQAHSPATSSTPAISEVLPEGPALWTTPAAATTPQPVTVETKRLSYPVREPNPVELLPPIIYISAPEITPNTLIVYGFPKS